MGQDTQHFFKLNKSVPELPPGNSVKASVFACRSKKVNTDAFLGESLMEMTTNYRKQFLQYVCANVLSMIGMSVYILADTYFISKGLGANGLTALNLALPLYNFIEGTGQMIGIGASSIFIIHHYQGRRDKSNEVFTTALTTGLVFGIVFLLVGIFGAKEITTTLIWAYLVQFLLQFPLPLQVCLYYHCTFCAKETTFPIISQSLEYSTFQT